MKHTNDYNKELNFFLKALKYNNVRFYVGCGNDLSTRDVDLGVRKDIGLSNNFVHLKKIFEQETKPQCIIYITDEFFCHYVILVLPETSPEEVIIIGPYLLTNESDKINDFLNQNEIAPTLLAVLNDYYVKLPSLPTEDSINALLYTLADCIWGKQNYSIKHLTNSISDSTLALASLPDSKYRLDSLSNIDLIETFYAQENALMHAISHGQIARAKNILANIPLLSFRNQIEPLQNLKVFSIVMNTLFRKAAEQGGVHPIYIDQLSTTMTQRIVVFTRAENILDLWNEMIQKYCTLVNNHSTRDYSLPIQKVIIQINLDLSADLSLKSLADSLNVNASYLSTLFHKETGVTVSSYVNQKRMEYAAWLLTTTQYPISTIAQHCGILDDNYFTKLFKKQYNITPTAFRDTVGKHDLSK